MSKLGWVGIVDGAIKRIQQEGKFLEVARVCFDVADKFDAIDWEWFGLVNEAENGTLDENLLQRSVIEVEKVLGWKLDEDYGFDIIEEIRMRHIRDYNDGAITVDKSGKEPKDHITAEGLLTDYSLWFGHGVVDAIREGQDFLDASDHSPISYLEEFMGQAWQPKREDAREFLLNWYSDQKDLVESWISQIVWEEDEEDGSVDCDDNNYGNGDGVTIDEEEEAVTKSVDEVMEEVEDALDIENRMRGELLEHLVGFIDKYTGGDVDKLNDIMCDMNERFEEGLVGNWGDLCAQIVVCIRNNQE